MRLSPLAQGIYEVLLRQLQLPNPLISYGELIRALGPLPPPYADLKPNDQRLFEALGEVLRACQSNKPPLPVLTSIVVRRTADGSLGTPGSGYFVHAFPQARDEATRLKVWRDEVRRVVAVSYPNDLNSPASPQPREPQTVPRWLREPTVIAAIIGLAGTLLAVIIPVWISTRRDVPSQPRQADSVVVQIVPQNAKASQSPHVDPPNQKEAARLLTLDEILDVLERHRQRATFGAVAALLEREPLSLFNGYVRSPKTS